jgi:trimethylamine--corrinoid protein Co-methyltransferase
MAADRGARRHRRERRDRAPSGATLAPPQGGRFAPLSDGQLETIISAALDILQTIGIAGTPAPYLQRLLSKGARLRPDGRLCLSRAMVEDAVARAAKRVDLPGFTTQQGLTIGGGRVHIGTGGAAVQTLDAESGEYRESSLLDLYRMVRVLEACPHVHYGVRPLVARDVPNALALDVNTAFACLKATGKPIGVSFSEGAHVDAVIDLFDLALGREGGFRARPFCLAVIVHVVPPLRFAEEGCAVMADAIRRAMPLQICSAGQAGATSPASLAGALSQGLAETLAGLMLVDALSPGHPCIFAFMPFISDLRTGAMTGGGGEAAIASAAAAQLLARLDLPSAVSAGMTDAKIADAQAGYEKGYTVALAAQAGADMVQLSAGMLGSIMVASPEALVIDDEMCGAILRTVRNVEVREDLIDLEMIEQVVTGEGHYLGQAQTLELMKTEYLYPKLGDRRSVSDWLDDGASSIWQRAQHQVRDILEGEPPSHLSRQAEAAIRAKFDILLPEAL